MADRLPEHILVYIRDAIGSAGMKRAGFDGMNRDGITITEGEGEPTYYNSMTGFIVERTRLYRQSWIVSPLERVLKWSASSDDGTMDEHDLLGRLRAPLPNPDVLEEAHREIVALREQVGILEQFQRDVGASLERMGHGKE